MSSQMHVGLDTQPLRMGVLTLLHRTGNAESKTKRMLWSVCDWLLAVRRTYICDHFPSGLVPLSVVGPLQFLLEHALSGRAVLQGKFAQDFAEAVNADLARRVHRVAQEQEKGVEPAGTQRCVSQTRGCRGRT